MVRQRIATVWLIAALLCGCAQGRNTRTPVQPVQTPPVVEKVQAAPKAVDVAAEPKPQPAPALFIPGPQQPEQFAMNQPVAGTLPLAMGLAEQVAPVPLMLPVANELPQVVQQMPPIVPNQPEAPPEVNPGPARVASPLRDLAARAAQQTVSMNNYIMRLRRREVVAGQKRPEELLMCRFRKEPWSVYFKWIGPEAKNREVVYVKDRYENVIHTLTAPGDVFFLPGGKHFKVSPDSALVRGKSRYPITEAGIHNLVARFARMVEAHEKGEAREGAIKHLGTLKRPEFDAPLETVLQVLPPKVDPTLPQGGQRHWYFDTTLSLPVLLITTDETGREVEYYCHDRFEINVRLDDDDFNPEKLFKTTSP